MKHQSNIKYQVFIDYLQVFSLTCSTEQLQYQ